MRNQGTWWRVILSGMGIAMGGLVAAADDGGTETTTLRPARERLVEFWLIGGSDSGNPARRNVKTRQVGSGGWTDFVDERARPAYQWGIRRFWLHNPFGTVPGEVMQFDQYLDAKEAGLGDLTDDFVSAWRPVVRGRFGEPVELVAYIGTANFADDRLAAAGGDGNPAAVVATALKCIKPLLLAGASIGADAASRLPDDGPEFGFYRFLEGVGMRVYIEARPRLDAPGWKHFPVASMEGWWHSSDPAQRATSPRVANEEIEGEIVRVLNELKGGSSAPADVQASIAAIRAALLDGHTVVFRGDGLREAGVTIDQLVAGIDEELGVPSEPRSAVATTGRTETDGAATGRLAPLEEGEAEARSGVKVRKRELRPFVRIQSREGSE